MTREFTRVMGVSPSRYYREALGAPVMCRAEQVALERSTPLGVVGVGFEYDSGALRAAG